jgi:DNA-directed RNA polymerase sigma subunit (sigma70/sigma32)
MSSPHCRHPLASHSEPTRRAAAAVDIDELRLLVDRLLLELDEREARLLADRFGLHGHESQTVRDLAARQGISADTAQIAIGRALGRLRDLL